jgi:hypothetical protein
VKKKAVDHTGKGGVSDQKKKPDSNRMEKPDSLDKISRKEAISRAGKYAAFTASSMMVILNPLKAEYGDSPADLPPEWFY